MSHQTQYHGGIMDSLKWIVVLALAVFGVVGNYHYAEQSVLIRVLLLLAIAGAALFVAYKTSKGQRFWQFAMDAKSEVRKVVWPSRQETIQTTLIVLAIVTVVSLILWGIDAVLLKAVALITGYGAH
tara:strand:- start:39323 stop:39703 length:381 start_codon:yes stop_codon:yes gene_type:complete